MMNHLVAERMANALQPGDLRLLRGSKMGKAEYLIAMGWAGIHHKTASAIYHLAITFDPGLYVPTLLIVERKVRNLAMRRNWDEKPHQLHEIARKALHFILFPACPKCHGRGYHSIAGTNRLSDKPCPSCLGSGKRRISTRRLSDVIAEIGEFEREMTSAVFKVIR